MNNNVYLAFFDLLGTQNFSGSATDYYKNIIELQKRIVDNHAYLNQNDNIYKIAFFSDSCYVESKNLVELIKYLEALRDDLSTLSLFFNAAVIKIDNKSNDYKSFDYTNATYNDNCNVSGIMFYDNSVAKAYVEQNRFKGIGIHLSKEVIDDFRSNKELKGKLTKSIYLSDHKKYDSLTLYYDVVCSFPDDVLREHWFMTIVKAYFFACCDNPRYGKYYISLLTNIINNSSVDIEWDNRTSKFVNSDAIYNIMLSIFTSKDKYSLLTGIDIIAVVFINKILSSNLPPHHIVEIIHILLNEVAKKYLTNLDSVPWIAFLEKNNNEEQFKKYCREYIVLEKINDCGTN